MSGDNLEEIEPLLSWYKRTGHVQVESLGLDGRTIILKIEGRKRSIRSLVALYDPSLDGDLSAWLRDLVDSHRRAGIEFDRVEIWTSSEVADELSAESEEIDVSIDVVIRSLSELGSPVSPTLTTLPSEKRAIGRRTRRKPSLRKEESRTVVVVERREERNDRYPEPDQIREDSLAAILNEIKRTIDQSMRSIIEEVRKGNEIDLLNKIHELEKRVELLEAMIRLLGSQQGTVNLPPAWAARNNPPPRMEPTVLRGELKREQPAEPEDVGMGGKENAEPTLGYSHQVNIPSGRESGGSEESQTTGSEDILEEILSNPWVEILRRKGEDIEG